MTRPEEARQILPNSKAVNILWTINARSLINFFHQRLCYRNVEEMRIFADRMHAVCMGWFPQLFQFVGPECTFMKRCNQGKMMAPQCKGRYPWTADVPKT